MRVPIPRELTMILPSLALNNNDSDSFAGGDVHETHQQTATDTTRASIQNETNQTLLNGEQNDSHDNSSQAEVIEKEDAHVTLALNSSHHLSTKLHPVVHHILGSSPNTSESKLSSIPNHSVDHNQGNSSVPTQIQPAQHHQPSSPNIPITYVDETLKGKYGSLHVDATGKYTFTLDPKAPAYILLQKQEPGTDTFTLHLSNGSSVIIHIPVQGKQDAPTISGDLQGQVTEDHNVDSHGLISTSGKIDVVDPDHDESSLQPETIVGQFGTLTVNANGHWQYQVDNSQINIQALTSQTALHESFTIHTKDGTPQVLNMTIGGEDDNAVISGVDAGTVTEDQTTHAQGQLLVTDSDLGEDHFQASQVIGQFGTLTITKDGAWSYDLDNSNPKVQALGQGATATETITVSSADGTQHQVTITVNGTNDRPMVSGTSTGAVVEQGLNTSGTPDATGSLTATDLDTSDTITWAVNQPQGQFGTLSIDQQGHWRYQLDNSTGSATDKLAAGEHQSESFWITATDSAGASTPQKIVIDVQGSNDKPVVNAWAQLPAGKEDQPVTIKASDLLTHASDVDATDNLHVSNLQATHGHLVDNKDGTYTFTPDKDFNGEIRLTYDVLDGHGGSVSTQAKFDLTAAPDNAQISYSATDNHQGGVTEDRYYIDTHDNLHFNGKLDIVDPDKGEAQFDINLGPQTYQGIGYDTKLGGHILIMQDGRYTYTIRDHQPLVQNLKQGETITDECVVKSQDGTPFTIKVSIDGTNDAPTLTAQTHSVTEDGASLSGQMVGQDVDHGASLTYSIGNSVDGLTFNADGSYSFDPSHASYQTLAQGQTQTLSIPVTVTDEHGASATQNLEIVVTGTNDAATVAGVDTGDVHENQAGQNMSPNYAQPGMAKISHDALTTSGQLSIVDPDTNEAIFDTKGGVYSYHGQYGHLLLRGDGHWEYAVAAGQTDWQQKGVSTTVGSTIDKLGAGETLTDTITIQTKDGTTHDIVVTIHGDNDAPYISGEVQLKSGKEDLPQTLTQAELLANSLDVDHNDIGKLSVANLHADHGSILDNKDGTYTFTPDKNYNGQVHFTYDVKDAHGGTTHTGANTTLVATPDKAIISEVTTGSVIEDGPHATHNNGTTTELASGQLQVIDPDSGEDKFQYSQFGETRIHDPFGGMLRIDSAGNWGYSVDNAALQHLAQGQVETVTYRVHSFDGTAYDLNIDVVGTNDAPTVTKVVLRNGTEDINYQIQASQFGFSDVDTGDTLHSIAITDLPPAAQGKFMLDGHDITAGQSIPAADIAKLQFVPTPDFNGDVQFKFTVNDGHVDSQEATNTLHIDAVGDAATISGRDTGDVHEGHAYTAPDGTMSGGYVDDRSPDHMHGNVGKIWNDEIHTDGHLNIIDPDSGESHAQTGTYQGTLGHVILQSNGDWSYYASIGQDATGRKIDRLGQGESITDTVTVKSADGTTHDIHITIHGDNDRPYCSSEVQLNSGKEDLAQTITTTELLANTVDVDANDAGQLSIANLRADHGTLVDNKDGTFTFTPEHNYNGQVHFTYDVKDAHGGVTHTGASTTLLPSNDAATLQPTLASNFVTEDHLKSGTSTNELWSGWKNLDIQDIDSPSEAKVTQIEINGVKHTVPANFAMNLAGVHGTFSFTHSTDGHDKWSYSADNSHAEVQSLSHGDSLTDTINLITADGTRIPLTAKILGTDDHVVIDTPDALTAALGTAVEDKITSISGTLLAHDSDSKDSVTFNAGDSVGAYGTLHVDSNGQWHYDLDHSKANALQQGETKAEGFDITATSTDGSTATKHIEVLVQGSNDQATITVVSNPDVHEDGSSTPVEVISGQLNVVDPDHDQSEFSTDVGKRHDPFNSGVHGGLHISKDGSWTYSVNNSQIQQLAAGQEEHVLYNVHTVGGETHVIDIKIVGTNDLPVVTSAVTLAQGTEDTPVTLKASDLLANATDVDDNSHLSVHNLSVDHGQIVDNHDGTFSFTPERNYNGQVQFHYDVQDEHGASVTTSATMNLAAVNDAASFTGDSGSITEDKSLHHNVHITGASPTTNALECTGHLIVSDIDGQGEAALDLSGQQYLNHNGSYGHFIVSSNGTWAYVADNDNQQIQDLDSGQTLTDRVEVTSKDGTKHSITVTINGTTDKPVLHSLSDSGVQHNGPIEGNLLSGIGTHEGVSGAATDTDSNAHLVLQDIQIKDPSAGYVTVTPGHPHSIAGVGTLAIEANGHYTFTPEAGFTGMVPSMVYRVGDDGGGSRGDSSQNRLTIEVTPPAQHAPTATPQTVTSDEDQTHTFTTAEFGYSDADHDVLDHITITQLPSHGLLTLNGVVVTTNQQISKADLDAGHLTFTPITNQSGVNYAHLEFTASDGHQDSASATLIVDVNAINDAPTVGSSFISSLEDKPHSFTGADFKYSDMDGDMLHHITITNVAHGTLTLNGHTINPGDNVNAADVSSLVFTPTANYFSSGVSGLGAVQFTANDGHTDSKEGSIFINIASVNDAPTVSEQLQTGQRLGSHSVTEDSNVNSSGQISIHDVDGDSLSVTVDPAHSAQFGTVQFDSHTNSWTYQLDNANPRVDGLNDGDTLQDTFTLLVDDGHGGIASKEIQIVINGNTDVPVTPTLVAAPQITGGAGHQDLHASLGIPPQNHTGGSQHNGWGILASGGHVVTSLHGQFGTLHVDPQTGHLDYDYNASSGVIKTHTGGSYGAGTDETDSFVLTLDGNQNSQVAVHLHLHSQSVHGHSGHHIDMTTLTGIDVSPLASPPPPPPPVMTQSDEVMDLQSTDTDIVLSIDDVVETQQESHHSGDGETHHGAAAYLTALGIEPTMATIETSTATDLPDDIDIVLDDNSAPVDTFDASSDVAEHLSHEQIHHDDKHEDLINPDEHHDQGDPSSFIDPY
ncbi:VCBS domain-containing protein [Vibrio sp. TBV020]|uniref:VCBS domain-containing protein n=1 Tax=Vibrio sp. TBV020 TaxID=3137398 RepID=UPI0038CD4000